MSQIEDIYTYPSHHSNINIFNGKVSKACIFQRNSLSWIIGKEIAGKFINIKDYSKTNSMFREEDAGMCVLCGVVWCGVLSEVYCLFYQLD